MSLKNFCAVLLTMSLLGGVAQAQTPAPAPGSPAGALAGPAIGENAMRLARDVVESSGISRSFDGAMPDIALRIRQTFAASRPEIVKDMDDTLVALLPEIRTRRGEMIERSARAIASLMTEAELKDISAFFNTPAGKKYVNSQPQILAQIFEAMDPWMQLTSEFFLTRFREEMRKKGHTV